MSLLIIGCIHCNNQITCSMDRKMRVCASTDNKSCKHFLPIIKVEQHKDGKVLTEKDKYLSRYNIQLCIKLQREYCEERDLINYTPRDGVCWDCEGQIYAPGGITIEQSKEHITRCPLCEQSYII